MIREDIMKTLIRSHFDVEQTAETISFKYAWSFYISLWMTLMVFACDESFDLFNDDPSTVSEVISNKDNMTESPHYQIDHPESIPRTRS